MKFTSIAILALIGDEFAVNQAHAMVAARGELQNPDYYDRSLNAEEVVEEKKSQVIVNKWDGLVHAQNGKVYDPKSMKEVALDTSDVQLDEGIAGEPIALVQQRLSKKMQRKDWCDSGIKGTNWCAAEEAADLNERTKQQKGLMFAQREKKDWCDKGIHSDEWCDGEVERGESVKTVDDKSLYEGATKAAWQLGDGAPPTQPWALSQKQKQDWCDSGIKGTNWCAAEEAADLNERTKQQKGLMFVQKTKKDWCDRQIHSDEWCDGEVERGESVKTVDDKSLYEGATKAAWQLGDGEAPTQPWALSQQVPHSLSTRKDWCDSGIKGTNWCAAEEAADLNERTKQQKGLMF